MIDLSHTSRQPYASDFTDAEWEILSPFVPPSVHHPNLQEPKHSQREMLNAIRYRTSARCAGRLLPHDFPPWHTVYNTYRKWVKTSAIRSMNAALGEQVREREGRDVEWTAGVIDSQSVKASGQGGEFGYDVRKKDVSSTPSYPDYGARTHIDHPPEFPGRLST